MDKWRKIGFCYFHTGASFGSSLCCAPATRIRVGWVDVDLAKGLDATFPNCQWVLPLYSPFQVQNFSGGPTQAHPHDAPVFQARLSNLQSDFSTDLM